MNVRITTWKISTLQRLRDMINPQPPYQRGEVWKYRKNALLIDSILRGIDIPKIYLRKLNRNAHEYEVADGQQRLNAILAFYNDEFKLLADEEKGLNLKRINNYIVGDKRFSELAGPLQDKFSNYEVTIAIVEETTNAEVRTLFGRLQEGEPLVPAEKRNAIISKVGGFIDNFAIHHDFFIHSRIPENRFKRQDYMSHGLALVCYENQDPLKADLLLKLYLDKSININNDLQDKVNRALDIMYLIDQASSQRIYKKFHFVDFFWYIYQNLEYVEGVSEVAIARIYDSFENRRLSLNNPESLITSTNPTQENLDLYHYYQSFRANGSDPQSISNRSEIFVRLFSNL